ncbi:hypothetical protein Tco_1529055, partial [Tanacetum coccineum]
MSTLISSQGESFREMMRSCLMEHPPSPNYVPSPEHLPSPVEVPYVPEPGPKHPPLLIEAMWQTLIRMRIQRRTLRRIMLTILLMEGMEPFKDEDDNEGEEEHLALADSSVVPVVDPVPLAGDIEVFETDESAPTPRSPQTKVPFAQTRLRRARKTVRLEPPMSPSMKARIAEYVVTPTPPSLPPSPLSHWSSLLSQIPSPPLPISSPPLSLPLPTVDSLTYTEAPLGYRAVGIR